MLMSPPPGYSPNAMNRQAMPTTQAAPGIQALPVQGHALQPPGSPGLMSGQPTPGSSSYSAPSSMPAPMPQSPHGNAWGALGPNNLNSIVRALGGTRAR